MKVSEIRVSTVNGQPVDLHAPAMVETLAEAIANSQPIDPDSLDEIVLG